MEWYGLDSSGSVANSCEHGNEPSGFHKMLGISWVAEWLAASREGLSSMELDFFVRCEQMWRSRTSAITYFKDHQAHHFSSRRWAYYFALHIAGDEHSEVSLSRVAVRNIPVPRILNVRNWNVKWAWYILPHVSVLQSLFSCYVPMSRELTYFSCLTVRREISKFQQLDLCLMKSRWNRKGLEKITSWGASCWPMR
jgi:hypothetical protein